MDLLHKNWQYGTVLKSLTAPWCSFFLTLSSKVYFMNKGHTKIASPAKKNLENLIGNQHFEGALYFQCADVNGRHRGLWIRIILD